MYLGKRDKSLLIMWVGNVPVNMEDERKKSRRGAMSSILGSRVGFITRDSEII